VRAFALKFVRLDKIDEHLSQGWLGMRPNAPHHHLHYGIEMKWICRCPVPGGFKTAYLNRVPDNHKQENAQHERAGP
jgi:hypothetical protein